MKTPIQTTAAALVALGIAASALGQTFVVPAFSPWMDKWSYPFGDSSGTRPTAPTFTTLWVNNTGTAFDDRDSEFLLGFKTAPQTSPVRAGVPSGFPAARYRVLEAVVTLTAVVSSPLETWLYDPTNDALATYFNPGDELAQPPVAADPAFQPDADAGRPVEIFLAGFRNGYTSSTFPENGQFAPPGGGLVGVRNVYPVDTAGPGGTLRDVSNNVTGPGAPFEVYPAAIGQAPLTPGDPIANGQQITFTLNVNDAGVQAYLQSAMREGALSVLASSLHLAIPFGAGPVTYPTWATRQYPIASYRPTLRLSARLCVADVAGPGQSPSADGQFTADDIIVFLNGFFASQSDLADVAGPGQVLGPDGQFTADDIIVFLNAFFAGC